MDIGFTSILSSAWEMPKSVPDLLLFWPILSLTCNDPEVSRQNSRNDSAFWTSSENLRSCRSQLCITTKTSMRHRGKYVILVPSKSSHFALRNESLLINFERSKGLPGENQDNSETPFFGVISSLFKLPLGGPKRFLFSFLIVLSLVLTRSLW